MKLNFSFDQEIQRLVISESLEKENLLIARSKSENQIESVDGIPTFEQYHALRKPVQSLVPFPTTTTSSFENLSMKQDSSLPFIVENSVLENVNSNLHSKILVPRSEKKICLNSRLGSNSDDLRKGLFFIIEISKWTSQYFHFINVDYHLIRPL